MFGTDTSTEVAEGSHRGVSDIHKSDTPNLDDTVGMTSDDESEESVSEDGEGTDSLKRHINVNSLTDGEEPETIHTSVVSSVSVSSSSTLSSESNNSRTVHTKLSLLLYS